jgi:hypothetical protein
MAQAISASIRVPLELSGPLVLGITSSAIGKGLTLKSGADRMTRGNLYLLGIAMSGDGKSSACRLAADPIQQIGNSNLGFFTEISKPEIKAELRILDREIKVLEKQLGAGRHCVAIFIALTKWRDSFESVTPEKKARTCNLLKTTCEAIWRLNALVTIWPCVFGVATP